MEDRGIIPAGAGRRRRAAGRRRSAGDHPRGCGEKWSLSCSFWFPGGSSPRVRGEEVDRADGVIGCGIIPAGAGRRDEGVGFGFVEEDHPRGCGEKGMLTAMAMSLRGSSPRVRGEVRRGFRGRRGGGIIPAGAGRSEVMGKTPARPRGSSPRVRGEDLRKSRERRGEALGRGVIH